MGVILEIDSWTVDSSCGIGQLEKMKIIINPPAIKALIQEINDRQDAIEKLKGQVLDKANSTIAEAVLQGQALIKAQTHVPEDMWSDWLAGHCPRISAHQARSLTNLAKNPRKLENSHDRVRQFQLLLNGGAECDVDIKPRFPVDLIILRKFEDSIDLLRKTPLHTLPHVTQDELRTNLEPVARQLWPERF